VVVSVLDTNEHIIEQGEAIPAILTNSYVFRASKRNDLIKGSTIRITVRDRPGNVVDRELKV